MVLPTTGPLSLNDVRQELSRQNTTSLNDADVRQMANKPSGTIAMADLRGKSAGNSVHTLTAVQTNGYQDKITTPWCRGYTTFGAGLAFWQLSMVASARSTAGLTISMEDYQELYDDGLVDLEPTSFYSLQVSQATETIPEEYAAAVPVMSRMSTMSVAGNAPGGLPTPVGTLTPDAIPAGYSITGISEEWMDGASTTAIFNLEMYGNPPATVFTRLEVRDISTGTLIKTFSRSTAREPNGTPATASVNTGNNNFVEHDVTRWIWDHAQGTAFSGDGNQYRIDII